MNLPVLITAVSVFTFLVVVVAVFVSSRRPIGEAAPPEVEGGGDT